MVFPSLGCLTCKQRRVKCDSIRPICGRCVKASRSCSWESQEQTSSPFRSENVYAQGTPRRPRRYRVDGRIPESKNLTVPTPSASKPPSFPVEHYAFHYWIENFATWPNDTFDVANEYGYALRHWNHSPPNSSLHLAVSALSLAVFGRANHGTNALESADKFYVRSIVRTNQEINELSSETINQLMAATTLMASYNNLMCESQRRGDQHDTVSVAADRHLKGTAALLKVRRSRRYPQDVVLERAVRRPMIRTYLQRGLNVPEWLQDGASYGEAGLTLELDCLIIHATAIRYKASSLLNGEDSICCSQTTDMQEVALEVYGLDDKLINWSKKVCEKWDMPIKISTHCPLPVTVKHSEYPGHHSTTQGHAAIWTRWYAIRLIINSVRKRLLAAILAESTRQEGTMVEAQRKTCENVLSSLAADLCLAVSTLMNIPCNAEPGVLGASPSNTGDTAVCPKHEIEPKMAAVLAWPLTVAATTEGVPKAHMLCFQRQLKAIASVIGMNAMHAEDSTE